MAMRVYFNTSALNRPLDALSSERVRLEAEAVVAVLAATEDGVLEWVGSEYLDFSTSHSPRPATRTCSSRLTIE